MKRIEDMLRGAGYEARRPELLAVAGCLRTSRRGMPALLLDGPPGCGKSFLAEALAVALERPIVVYQAHAWSDVDELFVGVDVVSAVAGDAEGVRQPGVLLRVAEISQDRPVILLLDEIDKTQERTEALLLDFLQSGRVPVRPGVHVLARQENVLVIMTSNGQRQLSDALLRRVRRVRMTRLPVSTEEAILRERTGRSKGLVRVAWKAAREVAQSEGTELSLQEGENLIMDLALAEDVGDVREVLSGWAARTDQGVQAAKTTKIASAVWAEVVKDRTY